MNLYAALRILIPCSATLALNCWGQANVAPDSRAPVKADTYAPMKEQMTAVVLRFAVQSSSLPDSQSLSKQACPSADSAESGAQPSSNVAVDPKVLDTVTQEIQKRLSKKMTVVIDPYPEDIPDGAWVISGCVTRANGGHTAGRLIGMNVGSSHLGLHVVLLSNRRSGLSQMDQFDLTIRGGNLLPPLGPVGLGLHLATDSRHTLTADARKLADRILKRLTRDIKANA